MEAKSLLKGLKSKLITKSIFSHLIDKKMYKIVSHSKFFQYLLNLDLQSYKDKFFESFRNLNFLNCLSTKNDVVSDQSCNDYDSYLKYLENKLNDEIEKNKIDKYKYSEAFQEYLEIYFTNIYKEYKSKEEVPKKILNDQLIIDIYSPLYKKLLGKDLLDKLFMLRIPFTMLFSKKIQESFTKELLNVINPNISSLYLEIFGCDKYYFCDFINYCKCFKQIKKIVTVISKSKFVLFKFYFPFEIFKFENVKNNLTVLDLQNFQEHIYICDSFYNNLKELNALEELRLKWFKGFHLDKTNLKYLCLSNCNSIQISDNFFLKSINLSCCHKIRISENCFSNMEIIEFSGINDFSIIKTNTAPNQEKKIQLPNLVKYKSTFCSRNLSDIFDFSSCGKLKCVLTSDLSCFLNMGEILLEKLYIVYDYNKDEESEKKFLKRLLQIKTLKEIKISLKFLSLKHIESIQEQNTTIENISIIYSTFDLDFYHGINLFNIKKAFPRLKEFQVCVQSDRDNHDIEINQYSKCILKFKFSGSYNSGCNMITYDDLVYIEFGSLSLDFKFEECFPLFKEKCDYIFQSLKEFKFKNDYAFFDKKFITNIIGNIDKMPNLDSFILYAISQFDETEQKKLMEKLSKLNIKNIEFKLKTLKDIEEEEKIRQYEIMQEAFYDFYEYDYYLRGTNCYISNGLRKLLFQNY